MVVAAAVVVCCVVDGDVDAAAGVKCCLVRCTAWDRHVLAWAYKWD